MMWGLLENQPVAQTLHPFVQAPLLGGRDQRQQEVQSHGWRLQLYLQQAAGSGAAAAPQHAAGHGTGWRFLQSGAAVLR